MEMSRENSDSGGEAILMFRIKCRFILASSNPDYFPLTTIPVYICVC